MIERPADPVPALANSPRPGLIFRAIYNLGYAVSYGVVFPTMLVARTIPTNNALVHGLCDGAGAADAASERVKEKVSASVQAASHKVGDAYAGVAQRVQERVESIQDAVAERRYRRRLATS